VRDHGGAWQRHFNRALYALLFARPWGLAAWKAYFPRLFPMRKPADFDGYLRALAANLGEPGRLRAVRAMMTATAGDAETALGRVRAPALVVMGTRDPDFPAPAAEARWIAERLHGSVHLVAGAGHYPHVEMPEQTAPAIVDFLRAGMREQVAHGQ
jgi:pimeloyl-ACP methyl ester carboxylesterase